MPVAEGCAGAAPTEDSPAESGDVEEFQKRKAPAQTMTRAAMQSTGMRKRRRFMTVVEGSCGHAAARASTS